MCITMHISDPTEISKAIEGPLKIVENKLIALSLLAITN